MTQNEFSKQTTELMDKWLASDGLKEAIVSSKDTGWRVSQGDGAVYRD